MAWEVGAFVSTRLKNSVWGSKTVKQLSEYLRMQDPTLRGYSSRNIYNMVAFYEAYSSTQFIEYQKSFKLNEFVQLKKTQAENKVKPTTSTELIVQTASAQFPNFLELTTLSNHFQIINACKTLEERIFYVLYSYKESLNARELQRCLKNNTFASLMGDKHNLSKGLKNIYPKIAPVLKDTLSRSLRP
jgi:hypothetical protein